MRLLVAAAALAAGCSLIDATGDPPARPDAGCAGQPPCFPIVGEYPTGPVRDLDILFVVDKSPDMVDEQQALVANFPQIVRELEMLEGGVPNLHIGIVSTDVGLDSGGNVFNGCSLMDDDGRLQALPRGGACAGPDGNFISDIDSDGDGVRERNFNGSLEEVFACIAPLGGDGCGFEQPLEAMLRALDGSHPENTGFLRPGAFLSIVIITSEDDCSAHDDEIFSGDPAVVGPADSFRCTRWGVVCDGGAAVDAAGGYTGCVGWLDSPYLLPPDHYVSRLSEIQSNLRTSLTVVAGPPAPFEVVEAGVDDLDLKASCSTATGEATPAVRLAEMADRYPGRSSFASVCDGDLTQASALMADLFASIAGANCLAGFVGDTDPAAGLQPLCQVFDVGGLHTSSEIWNEIPSCEADPSVRPCYTTVSDQSACPFAPGHLAVVVDRDGTMPLGETTLVATCAP